MGMLALLQFDNDSLLDRVKFHYRRGHGRYLKYFKNRLQWDYLPKRHILPQVPPHIDIEPTSICNMRCPMCFQNFKDLNKNGTMDMGLYKKIIDDAAEIGIFSVRLSHRGEPLIHPEFVNMVRYAKERGIQEVSTLTNGLLLSKDKIDELYDAGLDWLNISIDGVGETYEKIRKPAKFDEIVRKIQYAHELRSKRKMKRPVLWIQSVWSAVENTHKEYIEIFKPYVDKIAFHIDCDYQNKFEKDPTWVCHRLWHRMMILWNGIVPLCNSDFDGLHPLGSMTNSSIKQIWHGERFQNARKLNLEKRRLVLKPCADICNWGNKRVETEVNVNGKVQKILTFIEKK